MMKPNREFDLVAFGATGFTGRLVAAYLAAHGGDGLRWAIAGRNGDKLQRVHKELGLDAAVACITADSSDPASLYAMAERSRVVLTTVGPFMRYGNPLVDACVEAGSDYVDITGEPEFVNGLIERHGDTARERQLRIVSCCGFDSIPHDLGAYMMVQELPEDAEVELRGYVSARGAFSGGTWTSAIEAMGRARQQPRGPRLPTIGTGRRVASLKSRPHFAKAVEGWVAPMPTIDPQIVLRSARALPTYGKSFRYGHFLRLGNLVNLGVTGVMVTSVFALAQLGPTRRLLLKYRQSGDGPTAEVRAKSRFRVTFVAKTAEQTLRGEVSGGDPGYDETAKMVSQAALCLAQDHDRLPPTFGVLTTAQAMGERLIERLRAAGISFTIDPESA